MAIMTPTDPALDTYLGGLYGTPGQGFIAPRYVRNPSISTTEDPTPIDFETSILCDPVTNLPVLLVSSFTPAGVPTSVPYNANGTAYVGAINLLVGCGGSSLESDPIEMCDANLVPFLRWVVTNGGEPTGVVFNTSLTGAVFVPTAPVKIGSCGPDCTPATAAGVLTTWG